jgi:hypothetical protein
VGASKPVQVATTKDKELEGERKAKADKDEAKKLEKESKAKIHEEKAKKLQEEQVKTDRDEAKKLETEEQAKANIGCGQETTSRETSRFPKLSSNSNGRIFKASSNH